MSLSPFDFVFKLEMVLCELDGACSPRQTNTEWDRQTGRQTDGETLRKGRGLGEAEQMWPVERKNKVLESVQARPKSAAQRGG